MLLVVEKRDRDGDWNQMERSQSDLDDLRTGSLLDQWQLDWRQKRRQPRTELPVSVPVLVELGAAPSALSQGGCHPADLLNISAGGCCLAIRAGCGLQQGDQGTLHQELTPGERQSRAFQVRWLEESGEICVLGVQFLGS